MKYTKANFLICERGLSEKPEAGFSYYYVMAFGCHIGKHELLIISVIISFSEKVVGTKVVDNKILLLCLCKLFLCEQYSWCHLDEVLLLFMPEKEGRLGWQFLGHGGCNVVVVDECRRALTYEQASSLLPVFAECGLFGPPPLTHVDPHTTKCDVSACLHFCASISRWRRWAKIDDYVSLDFV